MAEITVGNRREARLHIYIWSGRAKRQRTGALQNAGASFTTIVGAERLGVRAALRRFGTGNGL